MKKFSFTEKLKLFKIGKFDWPRFKEQFQRFVKGEAVPPPPKPPEHNYNRKKP